jgi:predicted nucleic acid-binding protein
MRVVLSDTSPLHYLILIGEAELLSSLYGHVLIPDSVADELNQPRTPVAVRDWISSPPGWLEIVGPSKPDPGVLTHLGRGERDTILQAIDLGADLVLIDDREGVEEAMRAGLDVTGTLGVLSRASEKGLIDLPAVLTRLRATNFRASPALFDRLEDEEARRHRPK